MSVQDSTENGRGVKTLAVRLDPELHAQLTLVAQLRGKTVTDEIRTAIETHIASVKTSPEVATKAEGALQEIEREAAARRAAIATLFGDQPTPATAATDPAATPTRATSASKTGRSKTGPTAS